VLSEGLSLALTGVAIGAAVAFLFTPLINGLLIGVQPRDPEVMVGVAAVLLAATAGASWIPARRAAKVDPMVALRYE
jgi:ABC-type antimicrobial peptide transport system permease subunit